MKKKYIYLAAAVGVVAIAAVLINRSSTRLLLHRQSEFNKLEAAASEFEEETAGESRTQLSGSAAAPAANARRTKDALIHQEGHNEVLAMGSVYKPAQQTDRRLEYQVNLNYQINDLKGARAFFNQWIPRYGFLISESAAGHQNGYMSLQVRIRSSQLYAALTDLDAIGALTSENITVTDHTENSVYQQMLAAREEIRNRRRTLANANTGTGAKNWEVTENLLSQSEDKQLQTRIEEWRIGDRTGWATLHITLALPVTATVAPVEVPEFRNAFVGLLNVLLQLLYALIYLIPLTALGYTVYRISLRLSPALRRLLPRPGGNTGAPA